MQSDYTEALFSVAAVAGKGLGVIASRNLQAGQTVVSEYPFVAVALTGSHWSLCEGCLGPTESAEEDLVLQDSSTSCQSRRCGNDCGALYCSAECHGRYGEAHACSASSDAMRMLRSHALWRAPRFRLYCKLMCLLCTSYCRSEAEGNEIADIIDGFMHPPFQATPEVNAEFNRQATPATELLEEALGCCELSPPRLLALITCEGYKKVWCICAANAHEIRYSPQVASAGTSCDQDGVIGMALFKTLRRFNHSCRSNARVQLVYSSQDNKSGPRRFEARTACNVACGEELTINYCEDDGASGAVCRGTDLMERYGFQCDCSSRCS